MSKVKVALSLGASLPMSREEKPHKHQIGRKVAHPMGNNAHHFQGSKGQRARSPGKLMPESPTQRG